MSQEPDTLAGLALRIVTFQSTGYKLYPILTRHRHDMTDPIDTHWLSIPALTHLRRKLWASGTSYWDPRGGHEGTGPIRDSGLNSEPQSSHPQNKISSRTLFFGQDQSRPPWKWRIAHRGGLCVDAGHYLARAGRLIMIPPTPKQTRPPPALKLASKV